MASVLSTAAQDHMFLALVSSDGLSIVPDRFRILGRDKFLKFVELFGGVTVKFPSKERIEAALRDVSIYHRYIQDDVDMKTLAEENEIPYKKVRRIIRDVRKAINYGAQANA